MTGYLYVVLLTALTVLSARTLLVLGAAGPWTSAGWLATIGYDCTASWELIAQRHLPEHIPYVCLGLLTIAFVIAGVRDEPQGEPWWWPSRLAATRAERAKLGITETK